MKHKLRDKKQLRENHWYIEIKGHPIYNNWHALPMKKKQ